MLIFHETFKCWAGNGSRRSWFEAARQVYMRDIRFACPGSASRRCSHRAAHRV